jgi:3-hydroxyanthranilate 3,4-dioxygenase
MINPPFPLMAWIEAHRGELRPPVGNKNIYNEGGFMLFVVGGPNERTDWHVDPREELFYQIKGDMLLRIVDDGVFVDLPIREGELFRLPPNVPHSPQRFADTLGVVCEYARSADEHDGVRWYCPACQAVVFETFFHLTDTTTQLAPVFERFYASVADRTCKACGALHPAPASKA